MVELLDLCAAVSCELGDFDEARRALERAIELAPYDDHRYLNVASILQEQGRNGAALVVAQRARFALAQLGIAPPERLAELERSIAAVGPGQATASSVTLV
jgi:DNA-binding SARP family transcriptional activator